MGNQHDRQSSAGSAGSGAGTSVHGHKEEMDHPQGTTRFQDDREPPGPPGNPPRWSYTALAQQMLEKEQMKATLPEGWDMRVDNRTCRLWYYHHASRTATWVNPNEPVTEADEQRPAGVPRIGVSLYQERIEVLTRWLMQQIVGEEVRLPLNYLLSACQYVDPLSLPCSVLPGRLAIETCKGRAEPPSSDGRPRSRHGHGSG